MEKLTIDRQISESQEWRSPVPDDTKNVLFLTGSPLPRIPDHTEIYDQNKNNERPKLYLETVPNFVVQPTPTLSSLTLTLTKERETSSTL